MCAGRALFPPIKAGSLPTAMAVALHTTQTSMYTSPSICKQHQTSTNTSPSVWLQTTQTSMYTMSFTALTGIQNYSLTPDLNLCPSSWNEMGIPSVSQVQASELFLKSFTGGSCRGQSSTISTSCMGSRCIKEYECLKFWTTFCTKNHVTLPFKMSWMDTRPLSTCGLFSKGASVF